MKVNKRTIISESKYFLGRSTKSLIKNKTVLLCQDLKISCKCSPLAHTYMSWVSQGRPVPMPVASTQQTGLLELSLLLKLPRAGGLFSLQPRISGCPRYLNFTPGQMRDSQPSSTAGPDGKNLPKIRFPKFVKLSDYIYVCIYLTTSEFEAQWKTGHGNYQNWLKLPWKTRENTSSKSIFGGILLFSPTVRLWLRTVPSQSVWAA